MNDKQLIERLRNCAACDDCAGCQDFEKEACIEDLMNAAAERISDLLTELRDERHRHDRYVDFELAQAAELRDTEKRLAQQRVRAQNAEQFICQLCEECEWEDNGELTVMTMKCCSTFPECGKFNLKKQNLWMPLPAPPEESA